MQRIFKFGQAFNSRNILVGCGKYLDWSNKKFAKLVMMTFAFFSTLIYILILPVGEASEKGDRTKESEPDLGELLR